MRFDKTKLILDIKGLPIIERDQKGAIIDEKNPEMTFGKLVVLALTSEMPDPDTKQPFQSHAKVKNALLAERVEKAERYFECTVDEASTMRKLLGNFPPVYVMRAWAIIDEPEPKAAPSRKQSAPTAPAQP